MSNLSREASEKGDKHSATEEKQPLGAPIPRATFPMRLKLMLLAAFLATAPTLTVGMLLINVNADTIRIMSWGLQIAVLEDLSRTINATFIESQDALHSVGRVLTNPELEAEQVMALAMSMVEAHETIDHVAVYDSEGRIIDVIREEGLSQGVTIPEQLSESLRRDAVQFNSTSGDVESLDGSPRVLVICPLRSREDVTGYVGSLMPLDDVQERVERLSVGHFSNIPNSIFVADRSFRVLAHPDRSRAQALASASGEGILEGFQDQIVQADFSRSGEFDASDGTPMLGSSVSLHDRPWILVAQIPQSIAYESLNKMRTIVWSAVVAAIIIGLILGMLLAGRITAPLQKLTKLAGDLAARKFDSRANVHTRDELRVLAAAMSNAAEELQESEEQLRTEAAIRSDLGRYLPEKLVEKVVKREQPMELGGERRPVSIVFADVVSFTPMTEELSPEDVVTILNELFTILTEIVFRHGGTVDKFVGDCVMALWGAPRSQPDHAERAVAAAEDMMRWLETGNVTWKERFGVTIQLAIGVHSGEAVVGNIGSERRMDYTAIGEVVNIAARLESIARPQQILTTEAIRIATGEVFEYLEVGEHRLSERGKPQMLYEVEV